MILARSSPSRHREIRHDGRREGYPDAVNGCVVWRPFTRPSALRPVGARNGKGGGFFKRGADAIRSRALAVALYAVVVVVAVAGTGRADDELGVRGVPAGASSPRVRSRHRCETSNQP